LVKSWTETSGTGKFPQKITIYRCSNDECQKEKDKEEEKRKKALEEKEKRMEENAKKRKELKIKNNKLKNEKLKREYPLTPTVRTLRGALKGKPVDGKEYKKYLEEKYL